MQKYSWLLPGWLLLLQAAASDRLVGWSDDNTAACRLFPSSYTSQLHDHLLTPSCQLIKTLTLITMLIRMRVIFGCAVVPTCCIQVVTPPVHNSPVSVRIAHNPFSVFFSALAQVKDAQMPTHPSFTCERDYF